MNIETNNDFLSLPIEVLELDLRTYRTLARRNIFILSDIVNLGEKGLAGVYQLGKKQVPYIIEKLENFLQKTQGKTLADFQSKEISSEFESLEKFKNAPISVLNLPGRTINPLTKSGINTIGELLEARLSNYENVGQFGVKGRQEIETALSKFSREPKLPDDPRPLLFGTESENPNLIKVIIPFVKNLLQTLNFKHGYDVLKLRYGLEGSKNYTLQEIGDYYGITRERVRQIEKQVESNIQKAIVGELESKKWRIPKNIPEEAKSLIHSLQSLGDIFTESEIVEFLQKRYDFKLVETEFGSVRLWLNLSGFEILTTPNLAKINISPTWIYPGNIENSILLGTISTSYNLLAEEIKSISRFELVVHLNRTLKKKVDDKYLDYAIRICPDLVKISDDAFQLRFISLPSIGDKAYRILYEANKPLHLREILREINYRQIKDGIHTNVPARSLQQQLGSNSKFEPIGRSGKWSLAGWDHIAKETILELMQEYFNLKQKEATAKEVYEYVHSKRENVGQNSISTYLIDQKALFTKVGKGKFVLTAWGVSPLKHQVSRKSGVELIAEIDEAIKAMFADEKTDTLPLTIAINKIKKQTNRGVTTIRKRMSEAPYLEIKPDPADIKKKYLKYLSNIEQKNMPQTEILEKKVTIREKVQEEVKIFLSQMADHSAPLSTIASHVTRKTGCIKQTFYRYLSEMDNIQKEYDGPILICKLTKESISETALSFPQIDTVTDIELKKNLLRAVKNLNIDYVDTALFQLGKIFETELKAYLLKVKDKNAIPVTNRDLERLANMIDWLERNNVIKQKHHLTLLREQRNEGAHGDIPNSKERQKLMQYAPFLSDLYIKYIILINEKRQKL